MMVALSQDQKIFLTHFFAQDFDIHIIRWPTWVKWGPNWKQNSLILCRRLPYKEFDWNSDRLRFWVGRRKNLLIPIFGILLSLDQLVNASITIIIVIITWSPPWWLPPTGFRKCPSPCWACWEGTTKWRRSHSPCAKNYEPCILAHQVHKYVAKDITQ